MEKFDLQKYLAENKLIKEEEQPKKLPAEVITIQKYLEGSGKSSLKAINTPQELKSVLGIIFANMADTMKKNANALKVLDIINARLK